MRKFLATAGLSAVAALAGTSILVAPAQAGVGPPGGLIYAEGRAFQTVGTPTAFSDHGKFDTLYQIEGFAAVSEAAPGDQDFNGGRWHVVLVTGNYSEQPTSEEEVLAGATSLTPTDQRFECPLIPLR